MKLQIGWRNSRSCLSEFKIKEQIDGRDPARGAIPWTELFDQCLGQEEIFFHSAGNLICLLNQKLFLGISTTLGRAK